MLSTGPWVLRQELIEIGDEFARRVLILGALSTYPSDGTMGPALLESRRKRPRIGTEEMLVLGHRTPRRLCQT